MASEGPSPPAGRGPVWLPFAAVALTVVLFGIVLAAINLRLRAELRRQILGRDARVLTQVAALQGLAEVVKDPDLGAPIGMGNADLDALLQTEQLKEVVAHMRGLLAARLFDAQGNVVMVLPPTLADESLSAEDLAVLRGFEPISRFRPQVRRRDLFPNPDPVDAGEGTRSLLDVVIPLRSPDQTTLIGVAQLLLDGESMAAEFDALNRHLWRQTGVVFGVGSAILVVGLTWAFRRLQRANRLLHQRTVSLLQANEELAMAARTSAVGAVAAHLIHGLKNPLSGLQQFVDSGAEAGNANGPDLWAEAVQSTRRAQDLVREVTRVLQEEQSSVTYELTAAEFIGLVAARVAKTAHAAGVHFRAEGGSRGVVTNRETNLLLLIIENLLSNAIEATPRGGSVVFATSTSSEGLQFTVRDEGPGLPPAVRGSLFRPVRSTKPQGTGIGLAISQQLAHHLGARLTLAQSTDRGTTFTLILPRAG